MALLVAQLSASGQTLVNRYSFSDANGSTNVVDSVGGPAWNGTVMQIVSNFTGGPVGGLFTGSQLILQSSSEQYVQLPPGILSNYTAVSIDVWATFGTLPGACFLYGFGDQDTNVLSGGQASGFDYIFCQPHDGSITISDADPGWQGGQGTGGAGNMSGLTMHVTSVYNPPAGILELYTNGVLVSRNTSITIPMSAVSNVLSYIGRSLYNADSYFDVSLDEFRIWNGALNGLQVAGCDVNGPDNASTSYGTLTNLQLSVQQYQMSQGTHQTPTVMAQASGIPNPVDITEIASYSSSNTNILVVSNHLIYAVGQGQASIVASYGGLSATQAITSVASVVPVLMHRYSFTTDASDSVGGSTWTGTLNGNATITGGQLVLPNSTNTLAADYLQLPAGILTNSTDGIGTNFNDPAVTIEAWTTLAANQWTWANLFDFGVRSSKDGLNPGNDAYSISLCVHAGNPANNTVAGISDSDDANGDRQNLAIPQVLDGNTGMHVAVVFNPPAGYMALYTNGVLMVKNTSVTISMAGIQGIRNIIGADNWPDAGLQGSVDEFRIWNGALSSQEVALSAAAGPNSIPATVTNGPGSFVSMRLQVPSELQCLQMAPLKVLANYTSLSNFDLAGSSIFPPTGLTITSSDTNVLAYNSANGQVTGVNPGTAIITASYQGITNSASVTVQAPPATLVHRYSFSDAAGSTTVADSVGGPAWNGMLPNGGGFNGTGQLGLTNTSSQYVSLPSGILSNYTAVTIEVWVTASIDPGNSMLYAFGNTDTGGAGENYIFGSLNRTYIAITGVDPGYLGEQGTAGGPALPLNQVIHFTAVYDPPAGYIALYTNGLLQSINSAVTTPLSAVSPAEAFIGKSVYNGDPYASLTLDEFRIYNGALAPNDLKATQVLGPNQVLAGNVSLTAVISGGNIVLSWPLTGGEYGLKSTTNLTSSSWTTISTPAAQIVGNQWQVTIPKSAGTKFFRLAR